MDNTNEIFDINRIRVSAEAVMQMRSINWVSVINLDWMWRRMLNSLLFGMGNLLNKAMQMHNAVLAVVIRREMAWNRTMTRQYTGTARRQMQMMRVLRKR